MWIRNIALHAGGLAVTVVLGGLAAATLVRFAPGFGADEREFDVRLNEASLQSIRASRAEDHNLGEFYMRYARGAIHGDFGISRSLRRPVSELLAERGPVSLRLAGWGLAGGWVFGMGLAMAAAQWKNAALQLLSTSFCGVALCLPAAVMGLLFLFTGIAPSLAISLLVFPKIFSYSRNLLTKVFQAPHVLLARAKGLGNGRTLLWHVLPSMLPETMALAGISVSLAFSALIPLEAMCDIPGVGQLAWQAALGRDLPVLVTVTLLLALITRAANVAADIGIAAAGSREA